LRGQRRYLNGVRRRAASFDLELRPDAWWDLWHYHADWDGWGNRGWKLRREHLRALVTVFQAIAARSQEFHRPFQTWIFLSGLTAGADATYLHTPNPNDENFPLRVPELRFDSKGAVHVATNLESLVPAIRVGEVSYPDPDLGGRVVRDFLVFSDRVGLPIGP
jgi:hypothetical protein